MRVPKYPAPPPPTKNTVVRIPTTTACPTMPTRARGTLRFRRGSRSTAACSITSDPSLQSNDGGGGSSLLSGENGTLQIMGGVIIFLLALIIVAQVSRAAGKRRAMANKREEQLSQASVAEEEERRQAWIQHYLAEGNYAEARAWLGRNRGTARVEAVRDAAAGRTGRSYTNDDGSRKPVIPHTPFAPLPFQRRTGHVFTWARSRQAVCWCWRGCS